MKTFKLKNIFLGLGMLASVGCTDLSETTYDIVPQDGFYQTKENVLQAFVRPFGHGYWLCCRAMYWFGELSADHYMTVQRENIGIMAVNISVIIIILGLLMIGMLMQFGKILTEGSFSVMPVFLI